MSVRRVAALAAALLSLAVVVPIAFGGVVRSAVVHSAQQWQVHARPSSAVGARRVRRAQRTHRAASLVANGGFEAGLSGWAGNGANLGIARDARVGSYAARVAGTRSGDFSIYPSPMPVSSTVGGAVYSATAWVRSATPGRRVCLRIREWLPGGLAGEASSCVTSTSGWQQFPTATYRATATGHRLDVYAFESPASSGDSFELDEVDLETSAPSTTTTTTAPSTTVPTTTTAPAPTTGCTRFASPSGNDAAAGTQAAPFRTVQRLSDSLAAGETGCLLAGTYGEDLRVAHGGAAGSPVTLRSADPTNPATIVGRLYVTKSATDVVFANLKLDGKNAGGLPSPTVDSTRITFTADDVTNEHTAICFDLGSDDPTYGAAHDVVIDGNRIHDCGVLPATNLMHGIYVADATGTQITNNYIYANADRGIQLYPDAQGTTIAYNVIDGNGEGVIFSGDVSGAVSSDNHVYGNVITNSRIRYNVESYWGGAVGTGNLADHNCLWNGKQGDIGDQVGFTATANLVADPGYVDAAAGDYRLRSGSACAGMGPQH